MKIHRLMPTDPPPTLEEMKAAFGGNLARMQGRIRVVDYDPQWPALFEREAARLREVLGAKALQIEHVGSTSVPGLPAKPIIDIDLCVENSADEAAYLPALEAAGYRLTVREPEWLEHRLFKGPDTNINLHVFTLGNDETARHIIFREWLKKNEADRHAYAALKQELSQRDYEYMFQYNNDKAALIREILARALEHEPE